MDKRDENTPSSLWTRRSNTGKLSLSVSKSEQRSDSRDSYDSASAKRFGNLSSHGKNNPFNSAVSIPTSAVASPTASGASSAFGLGRGAFGFGNAGKTPKTPGSTVSDFGEPAGEKKDSSDESSKDSKRPPMKKSISSLRASNSTSRPTPSAIQVLPLRCSWTIYFRPPTGKHTDYEGSIKPVCRIDTVNDFWKCYSHLRRPSALPTVSDYHIFKEGIRPVWEDEENRRGGKWTMRLKKGVADRYWEDLLLALLGDQFVEASEEVCGAVVSVRSGEDVISIWTRNDGGRNVKIRETVKRLLSLPPDTNLQWRSHDESITQRNAVDQARQANQEKRRNTVITEKQRKDDGDAR